MRFQSKNYGPDPESIPIAEEILRLEDEGEFIRLLDIYGEVYDD